MTYWLDKDVPNSSLVLPNYEIFRRDREVGKGGGIICYINDDFSCEVIDRELFPSLNQSPSEFLCLFLKDLNLVVLVIYHPFWNNVKANDDAITVHTEVLDVCFLKFGPRTKFIFCGDYNDLHHSYDMISSMTQLSYLVTFPTRGLNTLDQVFTNLMLNQCVFPQLALLTTVVFFGHQ